VAVIIPIAIGLGIAVVVKLYTGTTKHESVVLPDEKACECSTCDCPNEAELMKARIHAAKAAIESIDRQIAAQSAKDPQAMYSDKLYAPGKSVNQARVSNAAEGDPITGAGETSPFSCEPDVSKGKSACMKASLQAHENVHQQACVALHRRGRDYRSSKTMIEYWKEDKDGYQAELDFLDSQIAKEVKKCMVGNYPGAQNREEQLARRAGSKRRLTQHAAGLPALPS
jgi:hypothetical protein